MKLIENNLVIQQKGWQDDGSSVSPADHRFVSSVALLVDNHPNYPVAPPIPTTQALFNKKNSLQPNNAQHPLVWTAILDV